MRVAGKEPSDAENYGIGVLVLEVDLDMDRKESLQYGKPGPRRCLRCRQGSQPPSFSAWIQSLLFPLLLYYIPNRCLNIQ